MRGRNYPDLAFAVLSRLATDIPGTYRVRRSAPVQGKVSIIIPTLDGAPMLRACLDSVARATAHARPAQL